MRGKLTSRRRQNALGIFPVFFVPVLTVVVYSFLIQQHSIEKEMNVFARYSTPSYLFHNLILTKDGQYSEHITPICGFGYNSNSKKLARKPDGLWTLKADTLYLSKYDYSNNQLLSNTIVYTMLSNALISVDKSADTLYLEP
jgi:hypothetical protein